MLSMPHQYIARDSGAPCDEPLFADRLIGLMYNQVRENAPGLFRLLTSPRMTDVLGFLNYDMHFGSYGSA